MPTTYSRQGELDLKPRPKVKSKGSLLLGIIGFGLFLYFAPDAWWNIPTQQWKKIALRQTSQEVKVPVVPKKSLSRSSTESRTASGRPSPAGRSNEDSSAGKRETSTTQRSEPVHHIQELDALVAKVKNMKEITAEETATIQGMLVALQKQGVKAVLAIRDFLRQNEDVNFTKLKGNEQVGYRTLRQAIIDTLLKIGGNEALVASLEQIQQTKDPIEMAMLARGVEKQEPGIHSQEVIHAISNALQLAEQLPTKDAPDASPFFDLLRTYGGVQAAAVLEQFAPRWGEYSLIALASLPEGAGIRSLTSLVGTSNATVTNPTLPFQILVQSSAHYPEASHALINLVRTRQIPDRAWRDIGETLRGKQLQFSSKMFDGTPLTEKHPNRPAVEARLWKNYYIQGQNIRYEQRTVSTAWSAEQVNQQLALIDNLLQVASSPAAQQALQQARESLQSGHRMAMR